MKRSDLSKLAGASLLALSLAVLPSTMPASAQTNSGTSTDTNKGPVLDRTPFQETKGDNTNWGWLGLLGLIGLANLFRKDETHTHHHDVDVVSGTGTTGTTGTGTSTRP